MYLERVHCLPACRLITVSREPPGAVHSAPSPPASILSLSLILQLLQLRDEMPPPSEGAERGSSLPGLWKYPARRDVRSKSEATWLADRRDDVGAEGLWRIHDTLYDLSGFVERHPGGKQWLLLTKGTDITEAFEAHHISPQPSRMLPKFEVKPAVTRRNSPYTFRQDGFYATLRRRVFAELPDSTMRCATVQSRLVLDMLMTSMVTVALLAACKQSAILAVVSGVLLAMGTVAAHNFLHLKENWRSLYLDLSMLSSRHWKVSHVLSHHLFPNSVLDLEVSLMEPLLNWLPREDKSTAERYWSWLASPLIYSLIFPFELGKRLLLQGPARTDLIPFALPVAMLLAAPSGHLAFTLLLWILVVLSSSLYFGIIGVNAAHHHPELFHDGDAPRKDMDWGLAQLDAVTDRHEISGVRGSVSHDKEGRPEVTIDTSGQHWWTFFLVLTNFGHHTLHHLFPSVDHSRLSQLYPVLQQTLSEFRVPFRTQSTAALTIGHFQQLANNKPNPKPPGFLAPAKAAAKSR